MLCRFFARVRCSQSASIFSLSALRLLWLCVSSSGGLFSSFLSFPFLWLCVPSSSVPFYMYLLFLFSATSQHRYWKCAYAAVTYKKQEVKNLQSLSDIRWVWGCLEQRRRASNSSRSIQTICKLCVKGFAYTRKNTIEGSRIPPATSLLNSLR